MKKEVLVYDNQTGYYDMLKSKLKEGFEFILFTRGMKRMASEFDAVLFFLHEEMELMDLMTMYRNKVPLILGLSKSYDAAGDMGENVYPLNLQQTQKGIIESLKAIFNKLAIPAI